MYAFLSSRLGENAASLLVVFWYAALLFVALLYSVTPAAEFRYGGL